MRAGKVEPGKYFCLSFSKGLNLLAWARARRMPQCTVRFQRLRRGPGLS
jgi:hypothetical protein